MTQQIRATMPLRVQLVDNWHDHWPAVLAMVQKLGKRNCLQLDEDGWLPARQILMVAFAGRTPVGFLCFRVEPTAQAGKLVLAALVEGCFVDPDAGFDPQSVTRQLREAAMNRALELRCQKFLGASCVDV